MSGYATCKFNMTTRHHLCLAFSELNVQNLSLSQQPKNHRAASRSGCRKFCSQRRNMIIWFPRICDRFMLNALVSTHKICSTRVSCNIVGFRTLLSLSTAHQLNLVLVPILIFIEISSLYVNYFHQSTGSVQRPSSS